MIYIRIDGAGQLIASDFTGDITKDLVEKFKVKEDDLFFVVNDSLIVHNGQEQTSFVALVEVNAPTKYKTVEKEVYKYLAEQLKNLAVHSHIIFNYFEEENHYDNTDENYPLFLSPDNMVKADEDDYDEDEDYDKPIDIDDSQSDAPYMGNIFEELDEYIEAHPEMSKEQATIEYYKKKAQR